MVTKRDIENGLPRLGLRCGDTVVIHSALSSFGEVEGGAETVVEALLNVLSNAGTLVAPTFTFGVGVFDPDQTPSAVGKITEAVRLHPGAVRSLHPTHSVAAIGSLADAIIEGHEKTNPFARGSALFNLLQVKGKILQLGTTHTTNSMVHVAEEIAGAPYLDRSRLVQIKSASGRAIKKWVRKPGCSQGFEVIHEALLARGAVSETMIGACRARLMSARAVVDVAVDALRFDSEALLCDRPDCGICAESRAVIAAKRMEQQDQEIIEMAEEDERTLRLIQSKFDDVSIKFYESENDQISPN